MDITDDYFEGMLAGIRRYAWWKDGVEHVGTCGTPLTKAIHDLDDEYGRACLHKRFKEHDGIRYCGRCGVVASDAMLAERKK